MEWITHFFYDAIAVNEYLWFIEDDMNALFKMNIKTLKMEYVLSFPNESAMSRLYKLIGKAGNKLICCPRNARKIVIYDTESGTMDTISADIIGHKSKGVGMYGDGILKNKAYLLRQGYSKIYQLDVHSGELSSLKIVEENVKLGRNEYFWHGRIRQYRNDTEVILYNIKYNAFYKYNVLTSEAQKVMCFGENKKLIDFVTEGHFIWGLCDDGILYKWDESRIVEQYRWNTAETELVELLQYKNRVYIMDVGRGRIIASLGADADKETDMSVKIPQNNTRLFNYCFHENNTFWLQWKDGLFYYCDGVNEVSGIFQSNLENIPLVAFMPKEICEKNTGFTLQKLLKMIQYRQDFFENASAKRTGVRIHDAIMED